MTHLTRLASSASPISAHEGQAVSLEGQQLLIEFEKSLDQPRVLGGRLAGFLPQARLRIGVSGVVAQNVFEQVAQVQGHLTRARASTVRVHNGLEAVRRVFRLPMMAAPEPKTEPSARIIDMAEAERAA